MKGIINFINIIAQELKNIKRRQHSFNVNKENAYFVRGVYSIKTEINNYASSIRSFLKTDVDRLVAGSVINMNSVA